MIVALVVPPTVEDNVNVLAPLDVSSFVIRYSKTIILPSLNALPKIPSPKVTSYWPSSTAFKKYTSEVSFTSKIFSALVNVVVVASVVEFCTNTFNVLVSALSSCIKNLWLKSALSFVYSYRIDVPSFILTFVKV